MPVVEAPPPAVRGLAADLAAHDSATEVLVRWCGRLGFANPPAIHAERQPAAAHPDDKEARRWLRPAAGEIVAYRRVKLTCGGRVLSVADNWYLPGRLTPAMNRALTATDIAFGVVARPLGFHRRRLGDPTWGAAARPYILRQRAVLVAADGAPFSFVRENYTAELTGPSPPSDR